MRLSIVLLGCLIGFDSNSTASPATPLWTLRYSTPGVHESSYTYAIVDSKGNSYFAGYDVVKVTPDGQLAWATRLPANLYPALYGIATDSNQNVYVGVDFFNAASPTNYLDMALLKFDVAGRMLWQVSYDPPDHTLDFCNGVGVDTEGNVYVAGRAYSYTVSAGYHTILKYSADGQQLWARRFEASTNSGPNNTGTMAVNPLGGVAVAASRNVASYSPAGDLIWSWQGDRSVEPKRIAFDPAGNLYAESPPLRVTKFSPSGQELWTAAHHDPPFGRGDVFDLKVDAAGNVYLLGNAAIRCSYPYDPEELVCTTWPLLVKFSASGQELWASRFGFRTNLAALAAGLAIDPKGNAYVTARMYDRDESLPPFGLVAKCDPRGNQVWRTAYRTESDRELFLTTPQIDPARNILVSGELIDRTGPGELDFLLLKFRKPGHPGLQIIVPPRAQTVTAGATVTLSVIANHHRRRLSYQWRFNGEPLPGQTRRMLTLTNVQPSHAGDYSVKVSYSGATVISPEARLSVTTP